MAKRNNHYDVAFESYLRRREAPYVAVDEARRSLFESASLKSPDFIVYSSRGAHLLAEVKGRRFPPRGTANATRWENWATSDDIASLLKWQSVFGDAFRAAIVFAYDVCDPLDCLLHDEESREHFRERNYAFYCVWADEYQARMKQRSSSWDTVYVPRSDYDELRSPIASAL